MLDAERFADLLGGIGHKNIVVRKGIVVLNGCRIVVVNSKRQVKTVMVPEDQFDLVAWKTSVFDRDGNFLGSLEYLDRYAEGAGGEIRQRCPRR